MENLPKIFKKLFSWKSRGNPPDCSSGQLRPARASSGRLGPAQAGSAQLVLFEKSTAIRGSHVSPTSPAGRKSVKKRFPHFVKQMPYMAGFELPDLKYMKIFARSIIFLTRMQLVTPSHRQSPPSRPTSGPFLKMQHFDTFWTPRLGVHWGMMENQRI